MRVTPCLAFQEEAFQRRSSRRRPARRPSRRWIVGPVVPAKPGGACRLLGRELASTRHKLFRSLDNTSVEVPVFLQSVANSF